MNKKVFAIILIVCLAFSVAFAAKKGDLKVGAQLGYGFDSIKLTYSENTYATTNNGGFYFAATGEYYFTEALAGKAEFGINTMGKAKGKGSIAGISKTSDASESSPMQFSAYVGAEYSLELSKEMNLALGIGWDMMIGKESKADDAKTNAAMGLGLEAVGAYAINKNVAVTLGAKFGWHFINTDDQIKKDLSNVNSILDLFGAGDVKIGHTSFKIFAGMTYAF